jgi:hypothetical protein
LDRRIPIHDDFSLPTDHIAEQLFELIFTGLERDVSNVDVDGRTGTPFHARKTHAGYAMNPGIEPSVERNSRDQTK